MSQAVICIVPTELEAGQIVDSLKAAGFTSSDVSALLPDKNATKDMGHEKHIKAPEGASVGASTGAILGGALGWLAGIGALAIPGLGPFIAAGPIMALLSGAALGGGLGGVSGGLIGLGIPEIEAKQYENKLRDGNILLSVHTENGDEAKRAEDIFKTFNATEIHRITEAKAKAAK
jgi:hypothetical protein